MKRRRICLAVYVLRDLRFPKKCARDESPDDAKSGCLFMHGFLVLFFFVVVVAAPSFIQLPLPAI
jgi:hypothetical protein